MKMRTKKCGVFVALAAVLLITATLITSCFEPVGPGGLTVPQGEKGAVDFTPPPGKGYIKLSFEAPESSSGRTIRPPTSTYTSASNFNIFDVYFINADTPPDPSKNVSYPNRTPSTVVNPLVVSAGIYEVHVYAYLSANGGVSGTKNTAAAYGADMAKTITGTGDAVSIDLKEIVTTFDGTTTIGNGTFKLNLTQPASSAATTAKMTVVKLPSEDATSITNVDLLSGTNLTTYSASLPAGYYRVETTLERTNGLTTTIREILHIYQGMTSTYTRTLPPVNTNVYTITYIYHDSSTANQTANVTHGAALAHPTLNPTTANFYPGYDFDGWFTLASGGDERVIGTYKPIKDETVHAQWTMQGGNVEITITVHIDSPDDPQLSVTGVTLSGSGPYTATVNRGSPPTIVITVDNAGDYVANSFVWKVNTVPLASLGTGATASLNFNGIDFQLAGHVEITVQASVLGGGYVDSRIEITVSD